MISTKRDLVNRPTLSPQKQAIGSREGQEWEMTEPANRLFSTTKPVPRFDPTQPKVKGKKCSPEGLVGFLKRPERSDWRLPLETFGRAGFQSEVMV